MTSLAMAAGTLGLHSVAEWFKRLNATLTHRTQLTNTMKSLNDLSDRELKDIGIHRSQITSIALGVHKND